MKKDRINPKFFNYIETNSRDLIELIIEILVKLVKSTIILMGIKLLKYIYRKFEGIIYKARHIYNQLYFIIFTAIINITDTGMYDNIDR